MSKEEKEVFGTKEWAESNHNIQFGCENNCLYCLSGDTFILMSNGKNGFKRAGEASSILTWWNPEEKKLLN